MVGTVERLQRRGVDSSRRMSKVLFFNLINCHPYNTISSGRRMRPANEQEVVGFLLQPSIGGVDGDIPAESIAEFWVRLNLTMDISRSLMP